VVVTGAVLASAAAPVAAKHTPPTASPANLTCTGTQSGGSFANVVVPAGASCTLTGVTVKHSVSVLAGGSLTTSGGTSIGHDLTATSANVGSICATSVRHSLSVVGSTGAWTIGNTCGTGVTVRHDLVVQMSKGTVNVTGSSVGHNLTVTGNTGASTTVAANTAGHDAVCSGNTGQTGGGNKAGHTNGCG
jgi:hypothetical protein